MILAIAADALQIFVFPMFAEGSLTPADDLLDVKPCSYLVWTSKNPELMGTGRGR
jgi:hypothetical protein